MKRTVAKGTAYTTYEHPCGCIDKMVRSTDLYGAWFDREFCALHALDDDHDEPYPASVAFMVKESA